VLVNSTISVKIKTTKTNLAWFKEQSLKAAQLYNLCLEKQFSLANSGEKLLTTFDLQKRFRSFELASDYKDRITERVGTSTNKWIKSEDYRYQLYWEHLEKSEKGFAKFVPHITKYSFLNDVNKQLARTAEYRKSIKRLSRRQKIIGKPRYRKHCSLSFSIRKNRQKTINIQGNKLSIGVPKFAGKNITGKYNLLPTSSNYQFKLATLKRDACGTLWLKLTTQETLTPPATTQRVTEKEKILVGIDMGLKTTRVAVAVCEESKEIYSTHSPERKRYFDLGYNALLFASNRDTRHLAFVHRKIARRRLDNINKEILKILAMGDEYKFGKPSSAFLFSGRLARSAADAANSLFLTRFVKRAEIAGKIAGEVDESYTSVTCRVCKNKKPMPLSCRIYECDTCTHVEDRDLNSGYQIAFRSFYKNSHDPPNEVTKH